MTRWKKHSSPTGKCEEGGISILHEKTNSGAQLAAIGRALAAGELKPGFGSYVVEPVGQFNDGPPSELGEHPPERQQPDDEAMLANMRAARDRLNARDLRVSQSSVAREAGYSRNGKAFKRLYKQL